MMVAAEWCLVTAVKRISTQFIHIASIECRNKQHNIMKFKIEKEDLQYPVRGLTPIEFLHQIKLTTPRGFPLSPKLDLPGYTPGSQPQMTESRARGSDSFHNNQNQKNRPKASPKYS